MMVVDGSERTLDCDNSGKKKKEEKAFQICHCESPGCSILRLSRPQRKEDKQGECPAFTGHLSTLWAGAWEALFKFYSKTI